MLQIKHMKERFVEDLKARMDIVEIVRRYAQLKKSGKNWMCRSPFRNERTPSFCVSPDKQFWYDFGNAEGGDVISFIEKMENLSFQESVQFLADIGGMDVPKNFGDGAVSREQKQDLFGLHATAAEYFSLQLEKNAGAKKYLKDRGISAEICKEWNIGYGGEKEDGMTQYLLGKGFDAAQIEKSGVAFVREFGNKKMRDRFDRRVLLPICEPRNGEIIAFSGRKISEDQGGGKYINSPENPVYHKSATLFGLHRARKKIQIRDAVLLVEGNFDVISAHSAGFEHCVATCGTALTDDHLRVLKRLTRTILLAFDSDKAGKKATLRGVEMCLREELSPRIVEISGGKDLDDMFQNSPDEAKKAIEEARDALDFLFEKFALKSLDDSVKGETKFLDSFFFFLRLVSRPIEVDEWLGRIAKKIKRSRQVVDQEFKRFVAGSAKELGYQKEKTVESDIPKFTREESFVGFLSAFWSYFSPKLEGKEALADLLKEQLPKELLKKKILKQTLSEEDTLKFTAWELHEANKYEEDFSDENKKKEFDRFVKLFKTEKEKLNRLEQARNLKL
jgi:DNA primase